MSRPSLDRADGPSALLRHPAFSDLDRHFASLMARLSKSASPELALAAALVSRSRGEGNICLDLCSVAGTRLVAERNHGATAVELPEFEVWKVALRECPVIGRPGEFKPLVLDEQGRIYLHRYWQYETNLAAAIRRRGTDEAGAVDDRWLGEALRRHFPETSPGEIDWQKVAAFTAMTTLAADGISARRSTN